MRKFITRVLPLLILVALFQTVSAQGLILNGFSVTYGGRVYNASTDRTTFSYTVTGTSTPPDLSHFDLGIPDCDTALEVVAYNPTNGVSFGTDPTTGVKGIKWDLPLGVNQSRAYTVSFTGNVSEGDVPVAVKGGPGFKAGTITGASCTTAAIDIVKSVSIDGGATWNDAEIPTGPIVDVGAPVSFLIQVFNGGDFPISNIQLSDSAHDLSGCSVPAVLNVDGNFECIVGPFPAVEGQHSSQATAAGVVTLSNGTSQTVTDTDSAHYYAGTLPLITLEKYVSLASGGAWYTADSAPGLIVPDEEKVSFRFVVSNEGTETFTDIHLTDSKYAIDGCSIPAQLAAGDSFECSLGPVELENDDAQVNIATVTAVANGETFTVSDEAHYQRRQDDNTDVVIIIEGPVDVIINNIIIIYGMEIVLDPNDPLLTVIHIGDVVHVEGNIGDNNVVIVVVIIIVDVDIYIVDGNVWRDDGGCGNPPPPWAPANGWRRKCSGKGKSTSKGMGMGK